MQFAGSTTAHVMVLTIYNPGFFSAAIQSWVPLPMVFTRFNPVQSLSSSAKHHAWNPCLAWIQWNCVANVASLALKANTALVCTDVRARTPRVEMPSTVFLTERSDVLWDDTCTNPPAIWYSVLIFLVWWISSQTKKLQVVWYISSGSLALHLNLSIFSGRP